MRLLYLHRRLRISVLQNCRFDSKIVFPFLQFWMERPVIVQNMVRILSEHQILSMTLLNILKSKYLIPFKKATSLKWAGRLVKYNCALLFKVVNAGGEPSPPQINLCQSEIRPDKRLKIISQGLMMIVPTGKDIQHSGGTYNWQSVTGFCAKNTRHVPTLEEPPQRRVYIWVWAFKRWRNWT